MVLCVCLEASYAGAGTRDRSSSLSRCPQGRLPALVAAVSTGSTSGGPGPAHVCGPVVEDGALRLSGSLVRRGWDSSTAHRACRDVRRVGSQPSLRRSRQARPAVGQSQRRSVARHRGWDSSTAHRACRDVRRVGSQPSLRRSRQARPAVGRSSAAWAGRDRGWDSSTAHRACRDVRRVGSQPSLRRSRQARPAVGQPSARLGGSSTRGWVSSTAHRACRDVRRVGSQPWLRRSRQARPAVGQPEQPWEVSRRLPEQPPQPPGSRYRWN